MIFISPPFGNYISYPKTISIEGSYTLHPRPGRVFKVAQFIFDNTFYPVQGGYSNRIGLRNPGIAKLKSSPNIISLAGIEKEDWIKMLDIILEKNLPIKGIELNVSCPNVHDYSISKSVIESFKRHFTIVGVKLSPALNPSLVDICGKAGVDYLHCSNTFKGISGYPLKCINLPLVENLSKEHTVVAGGGIYSPQDLLDYANVGATHFSISTICFHLFRANKLIERFS